ncbi:S-methyl-5-thioribose-1-phosphate isomerase [Pseudomonas sp. dw_358]|uniref:S-methyl-5-thioribose-1-phosphate isomerase n=1 Tax=Pseudomonas sp. dw_358 TaxID=2720083 RepID=UPI001BD6BEB5|nr:S-methyl-5-thioribose-1-phosphate isomerase [Pseudomonas sp. dw_358]
MRDRLLAAENVKAIDWREDALYLLDQRLLPFEESWLVCATALDVADAIANLAVGGASLIGICAAYGAVLSVRRHIASGLDWRAALEADFTVLAQSSPNSASLFWVLERMRERVGRVKRGDDPVPALEAEARAIHESDREANLTMAQSGVDLIRRQQGNAQTILTHGNTGALATGGFGTALGVIRGAFLEGMVERAYVSETRPGLQGARLGTWELAKDGIPVSLTIDGAAAHIMKTKGITWLVVGAQQITANGDVIGEIGTYQLAVTAMHHGVRFMVVAPSSIIDMGLATGEEVVIEERDARQLLAIDGRRTEGQFDAYNPVSDLTPADLIDVIVTEKGIVERPDASKLAQLMCRKRLH